MNPILAAALDAHAAGLSVVPVRADGTKRPAGEWKQYQAQRADRAQVERWFAGTGHGLGIICGAVSGDLEMLELEGRFMVEHGSNSFRDAMKAAGLELLLGRLVNGFMVISPSDGRHFYYRVAGEADPNTKLARRPATDDELAANPADRVRVLIETRGEGGFVVAPPSSGTVHPTGRPWQTKAGTFAAIPTITVAERAALFAVCRTFDRWAVDVAPTYPATPAEARVTVHRATAAVVGGSWMDAVVDHLRTTIPLTGLLEHYGWTHAYTDRHGRHLMTRPGKENGVSGSVNTSDRLLPFSTSVPFAVGGIPPATYDQLDVIAAYEHHGDRQAAARSIAERTGILDTWKARPAPPANVDPATGEIIGPPSPPDTPVVGPLDDEFWESRPYLAHIRQAARSRMVAPAAVLGCILARVAAFTPPSSRLPAIIGAQSTLSTYVALRARSGGGKSSATGCAADLLPDVPAGCVGPLSLGSGEGLIDAYFDLVEETDGGGKKSKVKRQTKRGALFVLDEGQALAEMGNRKGSTILPILRTAWSGSDAGQANASTETRRNLRAGQYVLGLVSLWQDAAAARLIDDADGGTPQRFVFLETTDPTIDVDCPEWPGSLEWRPEPAIVMGGAIQPHPLHVDPVVVAEIRHTHAAIQRGDIEVAPLDAHRRLVKLKLAGLLGILDGRHEVSIVDWALAERIMTHSDGVRAWIVAEANRRRRDADQGSIQRHVAREAAVEESVVRRALDQSAKAVHRAASRAASGTISKRDAHAAMTSRARQHVSVDEALVEAERLRWVARTGENEWKVGDAKPS